MKKILTLVVIIILVIIAFKFMNKETDTLLEQSEQNKISPVSVIPISHATAILNWQGFNIYMDPTGGKEAFVDQPKANMILVTDIHGDHLNIDTLSSVAEKDVPIVVPNAVFEKLTPDLQEKSIIMKNGETISVKDFSITAIPMYNIPESEGSYHIKGRGNGYLVEKDGFRVYIAGDTSNTPEMQALQNIDIAFVPMNLPYTMDTEEASQAVLAFAPRKVYPYHYRGTDGLSDVNKFKELVDKEGKNIEVVLLNWYKEK